MEEPDNPAVRRELRDNRRSERPVGRAGSELLADRRGVALQERGERGHEQVALADTRDILQRVRSHGFLHRPRPAQEKSRRLKAVKNHFTSN